MKRGDLTNCLFLARVFCALALGIVSTFTSLSAAAEDSADHAPATNRIPWSQIGAKAGADYKGDGLAILPTAEGARLRCVFQRLEGEATREGLWLTSTVTNSVTDRFRVMAARVGRVENVAQPSRLRVNGASSPRLTSRDETSPELAGEDACATSQLFLTGMIEVADKLVRFKRPGLTEEYSVSMDGVRQDFVVLERPLTPSLSSSDGERVAGRPGEGALRLELAVSGARLEPTADGARPVRYSSQAGKVQQGTELSHGARLVLEKSGREIAYSRLRVTDATGKELAARMELSLVGDEVTSLKLNAEPGRRNVQMSQRLLTSSPTTQRLAVFVNDTDAVYPIRIDPTFSDANWISMNSGIPGADNWVNAAVMDGSGNLYIGGNFKFVGNVFANRIAKWDGTNWSALGSGMNNLVNTLAVSGSDLYAGGYFTTAGGNAANRIAKWNGNTWSALDTGMNNLVNTLAVSGSDVFAGGAFTTAGGIAANRIAKWNGSTWSALGLGMNSTVNALAVSGTDLYVGGFFMAATNTDGTNITANRVAKWDGSSWSAIGEGMNNYVSALAVSGTDLYVGGDFTAATNTGGTRVTANRVAKWDGTNWSALGSGIDSSVFALAMSGSNLYAGGYFIDAGGNPAHSIAKWNGFGWTTLADGMDDQVSALAVSANNVYAGGFFRTAGFFTTAGGVAANYIAKWDGSNWSALGSGIDRVVSALAVSGSNLFAGGQFRTMGYSATNYVGKWDGSGWTALGSGMNKFVHSLIVSGGKVYAGGNFTTAGGSPAKYVARWDGSNWSALGSGISGYPYGFVSALAASGNDVYAGGFFTNAVGILANYIAKWDGSSWTNLGSGMNSNVNALVVSGSQVFAGGAFTNVGGMAANYTASWDGTNWSALGSGMNGNVNALAVVGNDLYAAGEFTKAGGNDAFYITKWDGSNWTTLGSGLQGFVYALAVVGADLYVSGGFVTATNSGGVPVTASRIAKWNGTSWSALGSGMDWLGYALTVSGNNLYVGGAFKTAGGKVSPYIARAYLPTLPTLSVIPSGTDVTVYWSSVDTEGFGLEWADALAASVSWVTNSASVTNDGTNKSVSLPATNSAQFFRLRRP